MGPYLAVAASRRQTNFLQPFGRIKETAVVPSSQSTEGNWLPFCHRDKRKQDQLHSTSLPALQFVVVHFISYPL